MPCHYLPCQADIYEGYAEFSKPVSTEPLSYIELENCYKRFVLDPRGEWVDSTLVAETPFWYTGSGQSETLDVQEPSAEDSAKELVKEKIRELELALAALKQSLL